MENFWDARRKPPPWLSDYELEEEKLVNGLLIQNEGLRAEWEAFKRGGGWSQRDLVTIWLVKDTWRIQNRLKSSKVVQSRLPLRGDEREGPWQRSTALETNAFQGARRYDQRIIKDAKGGTSERDEWEENGAGLAKPQHPARSLQMGVVAVHYWALTKTISFYFKIFQTHRKDPNPIFLLAYTLHFDIVSKRRFPWLQVTPKYVSMYLLRTGQVFMQQQPDYYIWGKKTLIQ